MPHNFTHLFVYQISALQSRLPVADARLFLDEFDNKKIASVKSSARSLELIYGRYLCKRLLNLYTNIPLHHLGFHYDEHGKPYIPALKNTIFFNLSHSKDFIAVCIADKAVGIDIEKPKTSIATEIHNIAATHFTAAEALILSQAKNSADALDIFYRVWTSKEAVLKALGTGFFHPMNQIDCQKMLGNERFNVVVAGINYTCSGKYYLLQEAGCHLAVAKCGDLGETKSFFDCAALTALNIGRM